jgi:uncharacterized protein (DUF1800 family)
MAATRKAFASLALLFLSFAIVLVAKEKTRPPAAQIPEDKQIVHALNRFTFGIRPGDVERVRAMGLDKWFDEQLHPDKVNDDALQARLAPLRTLKMSTREMVENFPPPQVLKAVENGRLSMPHDPAKRAIYESRMAAIAERKERKQDAAGNNSPATATSQPDTSSNPKADSGEASMMPAQDPGQKKLEDAMYADIEQGAARKKTTTEQMKPAEIQAAPARNDADDPLLSLPAEDRYKKILSMNVHARLDMAEDYRGPRALKLVDGMKPEQQETVEAIINPQLVVGGELSSAKLLRAIYSERQLDEVMTDFWYNHFNVFIGKGEDRYMITAYERDVIRPRALGKFKDLLVATAKSPAMLFYLDNWQSVGPDSELAVYGPGGRPRARRYARFPRPQQQAKNRRNGLNENYAREIMELHTLGVDGGYTQKDVTELAKVLTGWGIERPQQGGGFKFNERAHEPGTKYVLGHKIKEHGEGEGMEMLDILAHHPSTAKFISRQLALRFVSDNPPPRLIDRMAETFLKKDGDIREVLRTMFKSPEFWSADTYRAKVKTPLEFVASAARASGVDVQNALSLVQFLNRMGMPLYGMQPPTGYSMKADAWVNSSALLNRMNFALALGSGRLPGATLDQQALLHGGTPTDAETVLGLLEKDILAGDVSPQTHAVMLKQLNDPQVAQRRLDDPKRPPYVGAIAGLIMGSPEFQRR